MTSGAPARHYVAYHNAERMEYDSEDVNRCAIYTSKVSLARNAAQQRATVWLVGGKGKPRHYTLAGYFIAEGMQPSDHDDFTAVLSGTGVLYRPEPEIGHESWFRAFLKSQQNFSLGFREINDEFIRTFESLKATRG